MPEEHRLSTEFLLATVLGLISAGLGILPVVFPMGPLLTDGLRILCVCTFVAAALIVVAYFLPNRRYKRLALGAIVTIGMVVVYRVLFSAITYIYLIPGRGLGENSALSPKDMIPYRLFVVKEGGPAVVLHNVTVTLRDEYDQSQANNERVEHFDEIDPNPLPQGAQLPHFWIQPLKPWDEDYIVALTSDETSSAERIRVGCSNKKNEVFFAIRVLSNGTPMLSCRDQPFAKLPEWKSDDEQPCSSLVPPSPQFEGSLSPRPYVLVLPSSLFDMTPPYHGSGLQLIGHTFACPKLKIDDQIQPRSSQEPSDTAFIIEVIIYNISLLMLILLIPGLLFAIAVRRVVVRDVSQRR
jgi:hypothetical protein